MAPAATAEEKLNLVRLHWGIENGHQWALDVALDETTGSPFIRAGEVTAGCACSRTTSSRRGE